MYPSGFPPARIYGTPKMHKFSFGDSFLNFLNSLSYCFEYRHFKL